MSTKLTLTVDKYVIEEAKKYAKSNGKSLSNIVEEYLKSLVQKKEEMQLDEFEVSPLVQSLWGSARSIGKSTNYKQVLSDELAKKYLK